MKRSTYVGLLIVGALFHYSRYRLDPERDGGLAEEQAREQGPGRQ